MIAVAPTGFSGTTLDLLVRLSFASDNRLRAVELCEQLLKSPGYVSRVIDQAEESGLVERQPDPDDGRAQQVTLTDRGHSVLAEFTPHATRVLNETIYKSLSTAEVEIFNDLLERVAEICSGDCSGIGLQLSRQSARLLTLHDVEEIAFGVGTGAPVEVHPAARLPQLAA